MVVKVHSAVGREQRAKILPRQRVQVRALSPQHHQVRDVDDADALCERELAKQVGCLHDFEGQLGAGAYENDVRVRAVPCQRIPRRRHWSGSALRLLWRRGRRG